MSNETKHVHLPLMRVVTDAIPASYNGTQAPVLVSLVVIPITHLGPPAMICADCGALYFENPRDIYWG